MHCTEIGRQGRGQNICRLIWIWSQIASNPNFIINRWSQSASTNFVPETLIMVGAKFASNQIYTMNQTGKEPKRIQSQYHREPLTGVEPQHVRPKLELRNGAKSCPNRVSPRHICWPFTFVPGHAAHAHRAIAALLAELLPGHEAHAQSATIIDAFTFHRGKTHARC